MDAINIKYRKRIYDTRYGLYYEIIYYGILKEWGVQNGTSAAIIDVKFYRKTVNDSRDILAEEENEKLIDANCKLQLISFNDAMLWLLDENLK